MPSQIYRVLQRQIRLELRWSCKLQLRIWAWDRKWDCVALSHAKSSFTFYPPLGSISTSIITRLCRCTWSRLFPGSPPFENSGNVSVTFILHLISSTKLFYIIIVPSTPLTGNAHTASRKLRSDPDFSSGDGKSETVHSQAPKRKKTANRAQQWEPMNPHKPYFTYQSMISNIIMGQNNFSNEF